MHLKMGNLYVNLIFLTTGLFRLCRPPSFYPSMMLSMELPMADAKSSGMQLLRLQVSTSVRAFS